MNRGSFQIIQILFLLQAPEFLRGHSPSPACDVYSLAILLWQLDSREVPFSGLHPQTVMYQVVAAGVRPRCPDQSRACVNTDSFTALYQACWQPSPAARPTINVSKLFSFFLTYNLIT